MNCVFCNYDKDKIIREGENTITILSNPYILVGHSLVLPKRHYEKISEIPKEILHELIDEVQIFEEILIGGLGVSGCDIKQNYRPYISESKYKVNHFHFHLLPRYFDDELHQISKVEKTLFKDLDKKLFDNLRSKLK